MEISLTTYITTPNKHQQINS